MAFVSLANFLVLLLLLCSSSVVYGYRSLQGEYKPAISLQSDLQPVTVPPAKPPSYAFPRRKVVIHGVVECVFCKVGGVPSPYRSDFLPGAVVKLQCNNTKHTWEEQTTSSKGGHFNFTPGGEKLSTFGAHKCKVLLVSSPDDRCPSIDDPYLLAFTSATLIPDHNPAPPNNSTDTTGFFTVGRLLFAPPSPYECN